MDGFATFTLQRRTTGNRDTQGANGSHDAGWPNCTSRARSASSRSTWGVRRISVELARDPVRELALKAGQAAELERDQKLREELENATGLPIADLATLADAWA